MSPSVSDVLEYDGSLVWRYRRRIVVLGAVGIVLGALSVMLFLFVFRNTSTLPPPTEMPPSASTPATPAATPSSTIPKSQTEPSAPETTIPPSGTSPIAAEPETDGS
jgi:hypothetical protein